MSHVFAIEFILSLDVLRKTCLIEIAAIVPLIDSILLV